MKELLLQLKGSEKDARDILLEADKEAQAVIDMAKKALIRQLEEQNATLIQVRQKELEAQKDDIEKEKQKISQDTDVAISKLTSKGAGLKVTKQLSEVFFE